MNRPVTTSEEANYRKVYRVAQAIVSFLEEHGDAGSVLTCHKTIDQYYCNRLDTEPDSGALMPGTYPGRKW